MHPECMYSNNVSVKFDVIYLWWSEEELRSLSLRKEVAL